MYFAMRKWTRSRREASIATCPAQNNEKRGITWRVGAIRMIPLAQRGGGRGRLIVVGNRQFTQKSDHDEVDCS